MNRVTSNWSARRVLVTGASGFVGSWLVKALLAQKATVVVLIRDIDHHSELMRSGAYQQVAVVNGCLEEFGALERCINKFEIDSVFHLAAQAIVGAALRNPLPTFEANIRGTYHLLEACRLHAGLVKRVVVASSDKAYGESPRLPYTEDQPLCGRHPYDVSKSCTDLLATSYYATYRLPVSIARCGNIFGGGDLNWSRIVPGTIRSFLQRERPVLRSDGTYVRDYIYVEDAVNAYLTLGEATTNERVAGESFNFSTESYVTVRQIVEAIAEVMAERELPPIVLGEASHEIKSQSLSAEKARKLLGWKPCFSLEQGLEHSVTWYRHYLEKSNG